MYSTKCFVLRGTDVGEGNRYLTLFTRDLGLIRAVGKSLRASHSKLRHHLQDYSYTEVTLVRGREVWRITGAQDSVSMYSQLQGSREKQLLAVRVCTLLSRLLQGEDEDSKLFDLVVRGMDFLRTTPLDTELIKDFEYMFVIRILAELGYVGKQEELNALLAPSPFSRETLLEMSAHRQEAIGVINQALESSGL